MSPILRFLAVALALASPAGAATLTLTPSGNLFNVNDTLTVTLEATFDGSEIEPSAFIELIVAQGSATMNGASQNALVACDFFGDPLCFGVPLPWSTFATACPNVNGRCGVINQTNPDILSPYPQQPTRSGPTVIATAEFLLDTPGLVEIRGSNQSNNTFFGISIPNLTTGEITVVPEPEGGALVALGLVGFAAAALSTRRRTTNEQGSSP